MSTVAFISSGGHNGEVLTDFVAGEIDKAMNSRLFKRGLFNATVMLLLFGVAGLSTLAKNSQYFPKSNPTHYVNIASKMKVASSRVIVQRDRTSPLAHVMPPKPYIPKKHTAEEEADLPSTSVGVTVSIQHRSPPSSFC